MQLGSNSLLTLYQRNLLTCFSHPERLPRTRDLIVVPHCFVNLCVCCTELLTLQYYSIFNICL